jgi:hypothetical protein
VTRACCDMLSSSSNFAHPLSLLLSLASESHRANNHIFRYRGTTRWRECEGGADNEVSKCAAGISERASERERERRRGGGREGGREREREAGREGERQGGRERESDSPDPPIHPALAVHGNGSRSFSARCHWKYLARPGELQGAAAFLHVEHSACSSAIPHCISPFRPLSL